MTVWQWSSEVLLHPNPWVGLVVVTLAIGLCLVGVRLYQRHYDPPAERARKMFHIGSGLICLTLPWLVDSRPAVLVLGTGSAASMVALRVLPLLRNGLGNVLHTVERRSFGELYFIGAVTVLFWLADGDPLLFVIPMLVLTLADAVAAVIGIGYGRLLYTATGGVKSLEGSTAFVVVAFLSVHVPLLLFSEVGRSATLLIALIIAVLVMMAEAIAWGGLDNLFIPLGTCILLKRYLTLGTPLLITHLTVALLLAAVALGWRRRTQLTDGGLIGAVLSGYFIWVVGGWPWLIAPLALFLYTVQTASVGGRARPQSELRNVSARLVFNIVAAGLLWVFLARSADRSSLFYPFTMAFAAHLAMIGMVHSRDAQPTMGWPVLLLRNIGLGMVPLLGAFAVVDHPGAGFVVHGLVGLAGVSGAALAFLRTQPCLRSDADPSWPREFVCAAAASALGLVLVSGLFHPAAAL